MFRGKRCVMSQFWHLPRSTAQSPREWSWTTTCSHAIHQGEYHEMLCYPTISSCICSTDNRCWTCSHYNTCPALLLVDWHQTECSIPRNFSSESHFHYLSTHEHRIADVNTDHSALIQLTYLGILAWMPTLLSTTCVISKSTPRLMMLIACSKKLAQHVGDSIRDISGLSDVVAMRHVMSWSCLGLLATVRDCT